VGGLRPRRLGDKCLAHELPPSLFVGERDHLGQRPYLFGQLSDGPASMLQYVHLSLFPGARYSHQTDEGGRNASNEHPNRFVGWRSGEEPGNIGAERVSGVNAHHDEDNTPNEQSDGYKFIHNGLSMCLLTDD
jgi:hypothetical protein